MRRIATTMSAAAIAAMFLAACGQSGAAGDGGDHGGGVSRAGSGGVPVVGSDAAGSSGGVGATDAADQAIAGGSGGGGVIAGTGGSAGGEGFDAGATDVPGGANGTVKLLMIVGDSNGTIPVGKFSIGDQFTIARLQDVLHCRVTPMQDTTKASEMAAAAEAADLIVIAESVLATNVGTKLTATTKPIFNFEAHIQHQLGLTAAGPSANPGVPPQFALGVADNETTITVVAPTHPLAAGLQGTVTIYKEPRQVTWGIVAPTAEVVATLTGNPPGATIYVYRKGATLFDGSKAPGLRLGFFLEDDNTRGTANVMTDDGLRLFDTAIRFATNPTPAP